jgi:hypothetical protein
MRFILYLILFVVIYYIAKTFIKALSAGKPKSKIHNSKVNRTTGTYQNIEDADYTEIKRDEDKNKT